LLSILALAQHYRIRTRLLDWTTKPLVAAYFAAKDACLERSKNRALDPSTRRLAVYGAIIAIHDKWLEVGPTEDQKRGLVQIVRAPHSGNPNLHAQGGIFTVVRTGHLLWDSIEVPLAADRADNFQVTALTLSWADAPDLLYLLSQVGVSAVSVFPGFSGVVESLDEEKFWPKEFLYPRPQFHSDFWSDAEEAEAPN
jgi:hypothetical protein